MLDGELTIPLGSNGEPQRLPAGSLVIAPPLVPALVRPRPRRTMRFLELPCAGRGVRGDDPRARQREAAVRPQHPPTADGGQPGTDASIGRGVLLVDEPVLRMALLADEWQLAVSEVMSAAGVASTRSICTAATRSRSMSSPVSSC